MADKKISALTDVVTLAAGDKVPVADASDLSETKSATMTEVNTYLQTLALASAQITALGAGAAVSGTDSIPADQGGTAKKITATQLKTFIRPTIITGNSGTVDQSDIGATTIQILTSNNSDIPTTTVVTQLTASTMGVGWWLVEYWIIWQSAVSTTGITFIVDHTGTAANSQSTREDMVGSTTALATIGRASQASNLGVTGALPSTWSARADNTPLGPNEGVDTVNVNQVTRITAWILVTGSGNLTLQANSEIASTVTRVMAGTVARYTRLS